MRTCTSTRTGLHPVSHASSVTGGVRRSNRGGTTRRKLRRVRLSREGGRFTFAPFLRPACFPCPVTPLERCRSRGRRLTGLRGPGLEPGRRGSRVARCGVSSSNSLCIKRGLRGQREERIVHGNTGRACPCGGRGQRSRTRARASYLKTRCRSREAASGPEKRPQSIRYADVNGGLAETTVFAQSGTASSR